MSAPTLAGSEIAMTRTFNAPRELVWKVWTDPNHKSNWWGPRGFTTTTSHYDLRPGGEWRFVMHGPDGTDYINKVVFTQVEEPRRLAYEHSGDGDTKDIRFTVVINFEDEGDSTRIDMRMDFGTVDMREHVAKFGATEGLRDTMERFAEQLAQSLATPLQISRTFNAPREAVFKAFSNCESMSKWWGPKGSTMKTCNLDFRPGGIFHYDLHSPSGEMVMWGRFVYKEIVTPEKITYVSSFSDEQGNVTRGPFWPDWPHEVFNVITFTEENAKTTVNLLGYPINANDAEIKLFESQMRGMEAGFGGTFDQLEQFLAQEVKR